MRRPAQLYGLLLVGVYVGAFLVLAEFHAGESEERFANFHSDIACSECHLQVASTAVGTLPDFNARCRDCHGENGPTAIGPRLSFHSTADGQCTKCHSFHEVERITAGPTEFLFSFESRRQRQQCLACHGGRENLSRLSPGHREAARIFHSDYRYAGHLTVSETCMACHDENGSRLISGQLALNTPAPRFELHGSHPVGIEVKAGRGRPGNRIRAAVDSRLTLVRNRIECITCHSLSSETSFHLVGFDTPNDLCRGCHEVD